MYIQVPGYDPMWYLITLLIWFALIFMLQDLQMWRYLSQVSGFLSYLGQLLNAASANDRADGVGPQRDCAEV